MNVHGVLCPYSRGRRQLLLLPQIRTLRHTRKYCITVHVLGAKALLSMNSYRHHQSKPVNIHHVPRGYYCHGVNKAISTKTAEKCLEEIFAIGTHCHLVEGTWSYGQYVLFTAQNCLVIQLILIDKRYCTSFSRRIVL